MALIEVSVPDIDRTNLVRINTGHFVAYSLSIQQPVSDSIWLHLSCKLWLYQSEWGKKPFLVLPGFLFSAPKSMTMKRRIYISSVLTVLSAGCLRTYESPDTNPPEVTNSSEDRTSKYDVNSSSYQDTWHNKSAFGVSPTTLSSEERDSAGIIRFSDLTSDEQTFLEDYLPKGGIECSERSDSWGSLVDTLHDTLKRYGGDKIYLEREEQLYGLYMGKADQVFILTADVDEIEFESC